MKISTAPSGSVIVEASEESSSGHSTPRDKDEPVVRTVSMLDEALRAKDERVRKTKRTDDVFKDEEEVLEVRQDEYTSLLPRGEVRRQVGGGSTSSSRRQGLKRYQTYEQGDSSDDGSGDCSNSDEISSNSSTSVTSGMSRRQLNIFMIVMVSTWASSLTVCLFPPFFPAIAESKGVSASGYGFIIGTNCLTAFIVTPIIGNHLNLIGVKFAYCAGMLFGGVCCALAGSLEFFEPGSSFLAVAICIRIMHAVGNALVITSSFTYMACEFPTAVAKVFSLTRVVMNVSQLAGPWVGGMLYELDGFYLPFLVMGIIQIIISVWSLFGLPVPDTEDDEGSVSPLRKKKGKASVCKMMLIPSIWFSFVAFVVATMCNGFLSVNLEPKVIRPFNLSPSNVGLIYGLRDGANSLFSPFWGWLCDRQKKSVKPYLVITCLLVALSYFLMKASEVIGIEIEQNIPLLVFALCVNGVGIGGQQVVGIVDALHEAVGAGYPDDPSTQGLIAGLWSSLSGMGRFISRAGSGYLVDNFGFSVVSAIACAIQLVTAIVTFLYLVMCECHLRKREIVRWDEVTIVEQGGRRDDKVFFTENSSPSESLMTRTVYIGVPRNSTGVRIANSMPPKKWNYCPPERSRSRSTRS